MLDFCIQNVTCLSDNSYLKCIPLKLLCVMVQPQKYVHTFYLDSVAILSSKRFTNIKKSASPYRHRSNSN